MTEAERRGDFEQEAQGAGSDELLASWNRRWAAARPLGWELRQEYPDQWVRFHSLPGSRRYADSEEEALEALHRGRTLIDELFAGGLDSLLIIAAEWGPDDVFGGWSRRLLPESWPWKSTMSWHLPVDDQDPDAPVTYFWVAAGASSDELDALLTSVANDEGRCVLTDASVEWLFCPYDGGMDVLAPSARDRDLLRARHTDWLSAHPKGL
jgi:hypothetical protein